MKEAIKYEDFAKLDIRVGTVVNCYKHENADKLLIFEIDFGDFKRQILSGISKYYNPSDLIGIQVCSIVNIEPRKIRGIESHGMLLTAENEEDTMLSLVTTKEKINNGLFIA